MINKIIIIPDSFKGSMSSIEVAEIIKDEASKRKNLECISIPIADGGEGSVDCILASLGGKKRVVMVKSPENLDISAYYGITEDKTAIIEIAESSGITKQSSFCSVEATTYGFGQLIQDAINMGCRNIYLCLGGSATTDCGCGMAAALGVQFYDKDGTSFIPVGKTMQQIERIDFTNREKRIEETTFTIMSDVENPLYGESGAAFVFAPQKGASHQEVELLDQGLQKVCQVLYKETGIDYSTLKGGGAAGGAGCGCCAFLGAKIQSGIETMLTISKFDEKKKNCSLIITGEGKLDSQSLMGKVLSGIRHHADDIPIVAFCGKCEIEEHELETIGISAIEIGKGIPLEESMTNGKKYLQIKAKEFFENGGNYFEEKN